MRARSWMAKVALSCVACAPAAVDGDPEAADGHEPTVGSTTDDDDDDDDITSGDDDDDDDPTSGDDDDDDSTSGGDDDDDDDDDATTGDREELGCDCFESNDSSLEILCELPETCGTVTLPYPEPGTGGLPDPSDDQESLDAMACLLTAAAAGTAARILAYEGDGFGQWEYRTHAVLLATGESLRWEDNSEDLLTTITAVTLRNDVGETLAACDDIQNIVEQWECIDDQLTAGKPDAQCSETIYIEDF